MKKVDKPDWLATDFWGEPAARGFTQSIINQLIDTLNSVIEEVKGLQNNSSVALITRQELMERIEALEELIPDYVKDDLEVGIKWQCPNCGGWVEPNAIRSDLWHCPRCEIDTVASDWISTPPLGSDDDLQPQGTFVCQECWKDWRGGEGFGMCYKDKIYRCDTAWRGCGAEAVKWTPDTDKPEAGTAMDSVGSDNYIEIPDTDKPDECEHRWILLGDDEVGAGRIHCAKCGAQADEPDKSDELKCAYAKDTELCLRLQADLAQAKERLGQYEEYDGLIAAHQHRGDDVLTTTESAATIGDALKKS